MIFTLLAGYACVNRAFLHDELLPAHNSAIPWTVETESDAQEEGGSSITVNDATFSLDFDYFMSKDMEYPFASAALVFNSPDGRKEMIDLSPYNSLSFNVKCSAQDVVWFGVYTIDPDITRIDDYLTYRTPQAFFSCNRDWTSTEIDLRDLETPQWWLDTFNVELSKKGYRLDRVPKIAFGASLQSPKGVVSNVTVNELVLNGRDPLYLYALGVLTLLAWGGFAVWFFRQHTRALVIDIQKKLQKDRPLTAYQKLSIETRRDTEKKAVLDFMVTEYANPDLSVELMTAELGVNHKKINDILRGELGYTFSAYLNKLRLTEAARLLSENRDASVTEIAYSVGYKNVSYFNKLFRNEYGCTPKAFRDIFRIFLRTI